MPFVKLDTGILDSTLWMEKDQRDIFITALLMAEPKEFAEELQQIEVDSMELTGFKAPPGWYGFCPAAGAGIVRRSLTEHFAGMAALRALGSPDLESRSKIFDGRRMIRVNGGYVILNFMAYRDRDHSAAERMRRLRERRRANGVRTVTANGDAVHPNVTQAEDREQSTEAEAGVSTSPEPPISHRSAPLISLPVNPDAGAEMGLANNLLEELGVVADNGVRRVAADAIRLLAREGGDLQTAHAFILQAGADAIAAGEIVNRFWFTDQRYRPLVPTKTRKQREKDAHMKAFMEATSEGD